MLICVRAVLLLPFNGALLPAHHLHAHLCSAYQADVSGEVVDFIADNGKPVTVGQVSFSAMGSPCCLAWRSSACLSCVWLHLHTFLQCYPHGTCPYVNADLTAGLPIAQPAVNLSVHVEYCCFVARPAHARYHQAKSRL